MGLFDKLFGKDRELKLEEDPEKIDALSALAQRFYPHIKPGTEAQLLITRDKRRPNLLTEWTVASDPTDDYTEADEWKLIANGAKTLDKIKSNALLIAMDKVDKNGFKARVFTGDQINPRATIGGKSIKDLFFRGKPIDLDYIPYPSKEDEFMANLGKKASAVHKQAGYGLGAAIGGGLGAAAGGALGSIFGGGTGAMIGVPAGGVLGSLYGLALHAGLDEAKKYTQLRDNKLKLTEAWLRELEEKEKGKARTK